MNLELLKELRGRTGAGILDCREALAEAKGDLTEAIQVLRKKGIAKSSKKSHREVKEGLIVSRLSSDSKRGVLAEINCETDFVARNTLFVELTKKVLDSVEVASLSNFASDGSLKEDSSLCKELTDIVQEQVVSLGENLQLSQVVRFDSEGLLESYVHLGGKIGVLLDTVGVSSEDRPLLKDICLHIAASHPLYLNKDDVPQDFIDKEKEVILAQNKDKPSQFLDKIIDGKIKKYFSEVCLLEQNFVKDSSRTVANVSQNFKISRFVRFELNA